MDRKWTHWTGVRVHFHSFIYRNEPSRFPFLNSKGKDVIYSLNRAQKVSFFILVAVKKETSRNRMMPEASKRVAGG